MSDVYNDYINKYLGPTCVTASREAGSPQIPPSTVIACALQRGGLSLESTTDFNVFGLAYDSKYAKKKGAGDLAGYNSLKEAVECFIAKLHSSDFAEPNKVLKEKVSDDSEADKQNYTGMMVRILLKDKGDSNIKTFHNGVNDMIKKYSLYNFDNPNTPTSVDEKVQSQVDAAQGKLIAATKSTHEGGGFKRVQIGPETVTLTKLPLGKTNPCEPIYPDLITISDTIPEWVFREAVAQMNAKAEAAADIASINEG
ncbi:MAG: hypothetical protein J6N21_20090, partial [Butyrivibrio sp.]|nr:hypothetical protein [Butyrivibrio sp.]